MLGLNFDHILHQEVITCIGKWRAWPVGRLLPGNSPSTLNIPAIGYGIRYEYGIFDQRIEDGCQVEITDKWLRYGNPWEIQQLKISYPVSFGGYTESFTDEQGNYRAKWMPAFQVKGIAYDSPVPGFRNKAVNLLRLWKSEAMESFDFSLFNKGIMPKRSINKPEPKLLPSFYIQTMIRNKGKDSG